MSDGEDIAIRQIVDLFNVGKVLNPDRATRFSQQSQRAFVDFFVFSSNDDDLVGLNALKTRKDFEVALLF